MNLSLGFPEFSQELAVATKPSLEAVVSRFRSAHQEPDSPVRAIHHQAATEGEYAEMPAGVAARLRAALAERGIARLYTHQAEAFDRVASGRNVVIVTPTASGKTLCYNLPVLNRLMGDANARAMYLFPPRRWPKTSSTSSIARWRKWAATSGPSPTMAIPRRTRAKPSASAPTWCSPIPTCCTAAFCRTIPNGHVISRICATS